MILKKFAEQVARQVGVDVARGRERDAAKVVEEMNTMATTATVVEAVEDGVVGEEVVDWGELAAKAGQEAREVEEGGVVEGGEGEKVRLTCRQGPVQKPKTAQEMLPRLP